MQDKLLALAHEAAEGGMVVKAVLVVDYVDAEGERYLDFVPSDNLSLWDFRGLLRGALEATSGDYRRRRGEP